MRIPNDEDKNHLPEKKNQHRKEPTTKKNQQKNDKISNKVNGFFVKKYIKN